MREPGARSRPTLRLAVVLVAAMIACWVAWSPPSANELVGGDEGYYGTMARNMLADARFWVSPSLSPLGAPGDKPPLYPGLLAISIKAFGPSEAAVRWPSLLAAAVIALGVALLVARAAAPWAGLLCAALLMTLPWFADVSRIAAGEIPLTALGVAALAFAALGPPSAHRAALAGFLLGLAFLCKLWLVALIAGPVVSVFLTRNARRNQHLVALVAAFGCTAALHLGAVAIFDPASLGHWHEVYLRRSLAERVAGVGYAPYWVKPPIYYWTMFSHAFALMLPLVAAGFEAAVRRWREPIPRALGLWALGMLLLSAFAVKSGNYAYPVAPAWAALAALGAHAMISGRAPSAAWLAVVMIGSLPPLVASGGGTPLDVRLWLIPWVAFFAVLAVRLRRPASRAVLTGAFALAACAGGFLREAERLPHRYHDPGYRAIAAAIAPLLRDVPPERPCYVAPEVPALFYYTFRTGRYWGTPGQPFTSERAAAYAADTALRVFIVDPSRKLYGGWPDSVMLVWLERETREVTGGIERGARRRLPLRIFVRTTASASGAAPTQEVVGYPGAGDEAGRADSKGSANGR